MAGEDGANPCLSFCPSCETTEREDATGHATASGWVSTEVEAEEVHEKWEERERTEGEARCVEEEERRKRVSVSEGVCGGGSGVAGVVEGVVEDVHGVKGKVNCRGDTDGGSWRDGGRRASGCNVAVEDCVRNHWVCVIVASEPCSPRPLACGRVAGVFRPRRSSRSSCKSRMTKRSAISRSNSSSSQSTSAKWSCSRRARASSESRGLETMVAVGYGSCPPIQRWMRCEGDSITGVASKLDARRTGGKRGARQVAQRIGGKRMRG